ncbi:MAG: DUF4157 domain-containing protein [Dyadobacter fermentans]
MKIYTRQSQHPNKDQKPFIEPSAKSADRGNSFFAKSIQRKESEGGVKKDDEKKDQMQQQNKKLEDEKAQKKDSKEEEKAVQKMEDKKDDEKQVQKKDDKDKKDEEKLKTKRISLKENGTIRKKDSDGKQASADLEARLATNKGKGFALPDDLNHELSSKMGSDFSAVRIHTDAESAAMADELGALAFTYGNDIYFAAGQYNPATPAGKKLLVHELTHVMQQK